MDFNNGNTNQNNDGQAPVNNSEPQPFYSQNTYSNPQGNPQGHQGMPQGNPQGYQGMPQGNPQGYQGMPQGNPQGYQGAPQGQPQGGYQSNPQGVNPGQYQYNDNYQSFQSQGVPVHSTSQRTSGEYNPQAEMQGAYGQVQGAKPSANAFHVISLILGILSIICCCFGIVSLLFGVAGIILAIVGNKKQKHGVGTGGLVCSIIGTVLSVIILIFSVYGTLAIPGTFNDINSLIEEYEDF